ncbi:P-loop containing nucleoside triphosphate hydrolase protein [Coniochaeta ligniaria NRRL 30616]|uniref:p-loop containing nucleoside triphosphate hydrolase protein n=1 Tax=Coniochaeta ligniaria NRRL 30616 TaxID=1408157 RepID=A0A1J7JDB6_9PEZI|nr:P-loop containing nucleoside triphosphate hydrolase protein [Coniochaeta ligniaria NRRL 30616]
MEPHKVSILLLGDEKCGKSTFLSRISQGNHKLSGNGPITLLRDLDQPFIFELRGRVAQYRLEFSDTSGPENWQLLHPDIVIICYDISQRLSLINMKRIWIKQVRQIFQTEATLPVLVLGLKRDLRSESDPNGIIYPQEGHQAAQEMRADMYMECSAQTGELLPQVFEDICRRAMKTASSEGGQSDGGCCLM